MTPPFLANVKSVLSGDTLVVTSTNNAALETTLSLAYVTAPRLSKDAEEPFAFQSRDFLRNLTIGKTVKCTVAYSVPNSGRLYGTVQLQAGPELPDASLSAGWVKVREDAGRREESELLQDKLDHFRDLESQARAERKGIFAPNDGTIQVQHDLGSGPDFLSQWKGKSIDSIIERVITADRLLVRLLLSAKKHAQVMVLVAGIRAPATARTTPDGKTQPAEEYANEAKAFVEQRILQRLLKVKPVGISNQGQLITSVMHPRGNIAEFLLAEGLARCNDFHSTMLANDMAALRAAEKKAQQARLRLHQDHVAKATDGKTLEATVTRIIAADTIMVRPKVAGGSGTNEQRRINLSSIRGPRTAGDAAESSFREDAKEFVRKKLIGKHVRVSIDGFRPAADGFEARDVATVTQNGKNIGLQLVQEGLASVVRHRNDDADRAPNYDELLAAQETAKEQKKGFWSGKPSSTKSYPDVSENAQKAKLHLPSLSRQHRIPAVVDYCKAGSRFSVIIPREGIKLTLVLAGIRAPRPPRPNDKGETYGQEALDLANKRCIQRDCEIDVHDMDRTGGFIGDLWVNRELFTKLLLEEGLASIHDYSVEKTGMSVELRAAEKVAKDKRKGMWTNWDPAQVDEEKVAAAADLPPASGAQNGQKDYRDICVTHIDPNGRLKVTGYGPTYSSFLRLAEELNNYHTSSRNHTAIKDPKAGDYVAAKFSFDGLWYRGRIRSNDRAAKMAEVIYIDYGNSEKIAWAELRPLDTQFSVQTLRAQARDAILSFVQLPASPEYLDDAVEWMSNRIRDQKLVGCFDYVDPKEGITSVTLFEPNSGSGGYMDSLNREMIESGLGMVPRKLKAWERSEAYLPVLKILRQAENKAKDERRGVWEYGDLTED